MRAYDEQRHDGIRVIALLGGLLLAGIVANATAIVTKARGAERSAAERGVASIYGNDDGYAWGPTASGETMNPRSMTAAHPSLPFGTVVEVTNLNNGRKAYVRVNNRGPFVSGRIIDVTPQAGNVLGFDGLAPVSVEVVADAL